MASVKTSGKTAYHAAFCLLGLVGGGVVYDQMRPYPHVYLCKNFDNQTGTQCVDVMLAPMGGGPMYVQKMHVEKHGEKIDAKKAFPDGTSYETKCISPFFDTENNSILCGGMHPYRLLTVVPKNPESLKDMNFSKEFSRDLISRDVDFVIKVSGTDMFPFKYLTHTHRHFLGLCVERYA